MVKEGTDAASPVEPTRTDVDSSGPDFDTAARAGTGADADPADPERRTFLARSIAVIGAGITAAVGIPAVFYVTGSSRIATGEDVWIRLGSVSAVEPAGAPVLMKATVERRTGYLVEQQEINAFVTTENGTEFTALSNVCTHLGCRVRWVDAEEEFFCPCHNAVFDRNGAVVQGPPPRPLDRFEVKVEEGQIYFKEA